MPRKCRCKVTIPNEILALAAKTFLCEYPRKLLMMCCVSKTIFFDTNFWGEVWIKHRIFWKRKGKRPHYYLDYDPSIEKCKTILKLVYGMFCNSCGCRYHHSIFESYRTRLCHNCLREKHISNNVLFLKHGIKLEEIIPIRYFIRHLSMTTYVKPEKVGLLSSNELDLNFVTKKTMIFFWKPDIERFFDLEERKRLLAQHLGAINKLKAHFKLLYVCSLKSRHLVEKLLDNEIKRIIRPITKHDAIQGNTIQKFGRVRTSSYDLKAIFRLWPPLPLMTSDEYCLKTIGEKLNLRNEEIITKAFEICSGVRGRNCFEEFASHVFRLPNI